MGRRVPVSPRDEGIKKSKETKKKPRREGKTAERGTRGGKRFLPLERAQPLIRVSLFNWKKG